MKKRFSCLLLLLLWSALLAIGSTGCGAEADPARRLAGKNITLNTITPFGEGDGNHAAYTALCAEYEQQYGVQVNDRSEPSSEAWKSAVIIDFASRMEPDVLFFFATEDASPFVLTDKVMAIDEIRAEFPDYAKDITPGVINTLHAADGKSYAVPIMGYWEGLFINRDLFDTHQVKVPETWDELLEAIDRFNAVGITPIAVALDDIPHYWFEFLIYNYTGPSGHSKNVPTLRNNRMDSWGKGLNDFKVLYERGAFPADTLTATDNDTFAMFERKEAAMLIDGSWKVGSVTDTQNVEVVFFPSASPARRNTDIIGGFSMGFYISRKAWEDKDKREAAVLFVQTMASAEGVSRFGVNGAALPISNKQTESDSPLLASIARMSAEATAFTPAVQDGLRKSAREYLFTQIPLIAAGEADIAEVLDTFAASNN